MDVKHKCSGAQWRLELFFKSGKELQDRVIPFLKENGIKHVNLTNKVRVRGSAYSIAMVLSAFLCPCNGWTAMWCGFAACKACKERNMQTSLQAKACIPL